MGGFGLPNYGGYSLADSTLSGLLPQLELYNGYDPTKDPFSSLYGSHGLVANPSDAFTQGYNDYAASVGGTATLVSGGTGIAPLPTVSLSLADDGTCTNEGLPLVSSVIYANPPGDPSYDFGMGSLLIAAGTTLYGTSSSIGWGVTWKVWDGVSSVWDDGLDWAYSAWKGIDILDAPSSLDVAMGLGKGAAGLAEGFGTGLLIYGGLSILGGFVDAGQQMLQDPQASSLFGDTPCFEDPTYLGCPGYTGGRSGGW